MTTFAENLDKKKSKFERVEKAYRQLLEQLRAHPPCHLRHLLNDNVILSEFNCVAIRAALE